MNDHRGQPSSLPGTNDGSIVVSVAVPMTPPHAPAVAATPKPGPVARGLVNVCLGVAGFALVAAGVAAGLLWFQAHKAKALADPDRVRKHGDPMPVRTVLVAEKQVTEPIGATCVTMPYRSSNITIGSSRGFNWVVSDIRLRSILVKDGDHVSPGQVMFEVNDVAFRELVKSHQAEYNYQQSNLAYLKQQIPYNEKIREVTLRGAKAEVKYRTEDLARRKEEYEAYKRLYETKGGVTLFQLLDSLAMYASAAFNVNQAERSLELAQMAVDVGLLKDKADLDKAIQDYEKERVALVLAQHDYDRCKVRSPIDGYCTNVLNDAPDAYVAAGANLVTVIQLSPILVYMDFPQERLDDVFDGQEAEVVLDSYPKETFHGKVERIMPKVNTQLRVLTVEIVMDNPKDRIKAGISGFCRLRVNKKAQVLPATAVIQQGPKSMVFCVEDGRAKAREVQTHFLTQAGEVEIRRGLKPGDEVVVFGNIYLRDNDPVNVDWKKWARRD